MGLELEEPCKRLLDKHLREHLPHSDLLWSAGTNPPDYWLMINGIRYAVEMTRTRVCRTDKNGDTIPNQTYLSTYDRIAKEIGDSARSRGILNGCYGMHSVAPPAGFDGKIRKLLIENALLYIEN